MGPEPAPGSAQPATAPGRPPHDQASGARRSRAERIARQLLLVEGAAPRAVFELKGSLVLSAVRCVLTYALIPLVAPVISWAGVVATPLALVLSVLAVLLAVNSLRRVWLADYRYRWQYTGFILVVLVLLGLVIAWDVRALLS